MRNKPLPGLIKRRSPLRQIDTTRGDVDTTWADKVYTKTKVDAELEKSGHHSEKGIRGKKKSKEHRQKISKAISKLMRGPQEEEVKKKISESMKGNKNSQNHSSGEYRKTQSEAMKKAWAKRKLKKA